jgi:hypothetical protein
MSREDDINAILRAHIDAEWPGRTKELFVWTYGPPAAALPRLRICRIAPGSSQDPWIYVTVGAWEATRGAPEGQEFILLAPCADVRHVETLAIAAYYHCSPEHRLALGRAFDAGRRWIEGSQCDHFLVSRPYPCPPAFEVCVADGVVVRFGWLLPITSSEADLVRRSGLEALESLLESHHVDVVDPLRGAVV